MTRLLPLAALLLPILVATGGPAAAETFEVQMLNKGAEGAMVFEPAFVKAACAKAPGTSDMVVAAAEAGVLVEPCNCGFFRSAARRPRGDE